MVGIHIQLLGCLEIFVTHLVDGIVLVNLVDRLDLIFFNLVDRVLLLQVLLRDCFCFFIEALDLQY